MVSGVNGRIETGSANGSSSVSGRQLTPEELQRLHNQGYDNSQIEKLSPTELTKLLNEESQGVGSDGNLPPGASEYLNMTVDDFTNPDLLETGNIPKTDVSGGDTPIDTQSDTPGSVKKTSETSGGANGEGEGTGEGDGDVIGTGDAFGGELNIAGFGADSGVGGAGGGGTDAAWINAKDPSKMNRTEINAEIGRADQAIGANQMGAINVDNDSAVRMQAQQLESATDQVATEEARLVTAQSNSAEATDKVNQTEQSRDAAGQELDKDKNELSDVTQVVDMTKGAVDAANGVVKGLEALLRSDNALLKECTADVQAATSELSAALAATPVSSGAVAAAKAHLATAEAKLAAAEAKFATDNAGLMSAETELQTVQAQLQQFQQQLTYVQAAVDASQGNFDGLVELAKNYGMEQLRQIQEVDDIMTQVDQVKEYKQQAEQAFNTVKAVAQGDYKAALGFAIQYKEQLMGSKAGLLSQGAGAQINAGIGLFNSTNQLLEATGIGGIDIGEDAQALLNTAQGLTADDKSDKTKDKKGSANPTGSTNPSDGTEKPKQNFVQKTVTSAATTFSNSFIGKGLNAAANSGGIFGSSGSPTRTSTPPSSVPLT